MLPPPLKEVLLMADVKNKWEKSSWGRKLIVQKRRASLNDFDRFKVMLAKIKVMIPLLFAFAEVSCRILFVRNPLLFTNVFVRLFL